MSAISPCFFLGLFLQQQLGPLLVTQSIQEHQILLAVLLKLLSSSQLHSLGKVNNNSTLV